VVKRLFEHDRGYVFQTRDARIVFALPYEQEFTLIGTTDRGFSGDPAGVRASSEEVVYLCDVANQHFRAAIGPSDVVWSFAGVRALCDDGSKRSQDVSRDYVLALEEPAGAAPLLTVYGGKITTARRLAELVLDRLSDFLKCGPAWTRSSHLPGGEFPHDELEQLVTRTLASMPFLEEKLVRRLAGAYGTRVQHVLGQTRSIEGLGPWLGPGLLAAEVRYLMEREWAQTADDVLWRRSKLGLRFSPEERARLGRFMISTIGTGQKSDPRPA
jgi:glycerol-3-phosphate dehydrogenase